MPEILQAIMQFAPSTHFVTFAQAILYRGGRLCRGMGALCRGQHYRRGFLHSRTGAVTQKHHPDHVMSGFYPDIC
jgi:hypothetical protein